MPFESPMKTISFLSFFNSKRNFLVRIKTIIVTINAIKNLKNTNSVSLTYCNPIFIAGKEVPHKVAAIIVSKIAFRFLFNNISIIHHS